ncbi:MAG: ATP-binding protein [Ignavibacteria bacterium]|nr:ATP-binding protein [Ignavibacteria bacterium]
MIEEGKDTDCKSLRFLRGNQTDWNELAKDCACFANAQGGMILIGIEDGEKLPPVTQSTVDRNFPDLIQKNIGHRTINVGLIVTIEVAENNAEYIRVQVLRSAQTIASTTDGKYYIRVHDECKPVPPDEMARLAADESAFVWEVQTNRRVPENSCDMIKRLAFLRDIRGSQRVSDFVKQKSDDEETGLRNWLGRLVDMELVVRTGKAKGTQYSINPEFVRKINFKGKTTLKNIEDHRLVEPNYKDLEAYPNSGFGEIHRRIGLEISPSKVKRMLKAMVIKAIIDATGTRKWTRYSIKQSMQEND